MSEEEKAAGVVTSHQYTPAGYVPFPGAYMAPVPPTAPTSAITIANQLPDWLYSVLPVDQRDTVRAGWVVWPEWDKQALIDKYFPIWVQATNAPPVAPHVVPHEGTPQMVANEGIPFSDWLYSVLPVDKRDEIRAGWVVWPEWDKQALIDKYFPIWVQKTNAPPGTMPVDNEGAPIQAGLGTGALVLLAAAAFLFFGPKK